MKTHRNPPTYYAIFCKDGHTRFNTNPVGAEVMQFATKADRADMVERINKAHSMYVNEAAWPITSKEAATHVNLRTYFDNSHEEACHASNGRVLFHYNTLLITR